VQAVQRTAFLSTFIGRQDEVRQVRDLVADHRLVTLLGVGGLGKTRLAYNVLDHLDAEYPGRTWAAELADLTDAALVGHKVAEALGVGIPSEEFDVDLLVAHVGSDPAVLYVDNCEHLIDSAAELIAALLASCPALRVLTTSRQALGVLGERIYPVPTLSDEDALELFTARAASVLPSWTQGDQDREDVAQLCVALQGIPLAIELTAVQVRTFTPATLLSRVRDHLPSGAAVRGEPLRKTSLDACVRWSYDLCEPDERTVWSRLSVFAGGFSIEAAEHACADDDLPPHAVLQALAGLVDKSVVERETRDLEGRYRMLEIIRQFGVARLEESGELHPCRRRHLDYYRDLVERFDADWMGPRQSAWMRQLGLERNNLSVAFEFAVSSKEGAPSAIRMAPVLELHYGTTGGTGRAIHWLQQALAHGTGDMGDLANALRVGSFIASFMVQIPVAEEFFTRLRALADQTQDDTVRAHSMYAESTLRMFAGDADAGAAIAADALTLLHRLGEERLEANLHFLHGVMLGWADRPDEAAEAYRLCFEMGEPVGEQVFTSYSTWGLGLDALLAGRVDDAIELERAALRSRADFQDQLGIALTIEVLAWAAAEQKRGREAALLLGAAEAIWTDTGMSVAGMPYVSRRREDGVQATRRLLSSREFEEILQLGQTMPQSEVISIALGEARMPGDQAASLLTSREQEVALLVAHGESNKAIADELVISVRTVETHVENLMRKLVVTSRAQVAAALGGAAGSPS